VTNPILAEYRADAPHDYRTTIWWLGLVDSNEHPCWTNEDCRIAYKVLDRLASLLAAPQPSMTAWNRRA
jgi:hypothetical protein